MNRLQLTILCYIVLVPTVLYFSYYVVQLILLPDDRQDHIAGWLEPFFTINSGTGFHPEPNLLNVIVTLATGILLARFSARMIYRMMYGTSPHEEARDE